MSVINRIKQIGGRLSRQQLGIAILSTALLAAALSFGLTGPRQVAALFRDCSENSVDNQDINGGCGAGNPSELIADIQTNNPGDLQPIYADDRIGLPSSQYTNFADNAVEGTLTRGGDLIVDGQKVMTGVWTMGRTTLGGKQPTPIVIGGNTYYHSAPNDSFGDGVDSLPAMVLFDSEGSVQAAVLNSCGNPVTNGEKVKSKAICKELIPNEVSKNTFTFTTNVELVGFAQIAKLDYFVDEGDGPVLFATTTDPGTPTEEKTFTEDAEVSVVVTFSIPGKHEKTTTSEKCKVKITVKKEVFHQCKELKVTAIDEQNRKFRFTVITDQSAGVTVESADFTLDGTTTTPNVTQKDANGNIFNDYTFDNNSHTVSAVVTFVVDGHKKRSTDKCEATVPAKNVPKPPKPQVLAAVKVLPAAGPGDIAGLFAGASAAGAVGHRLYMIRRKRR